MLGLKPKKTMGSRTGPFGVLDAGSSKLAVLIVEQASDGRLVLLGHALHASEGLKQGEIVDLEKFSTALGKTVQIAERAAGLTINQLHLVTAAGQPRLAIYRHQIDLADSQITPRDLRRLAARQKDNTPAEGRLVIDRQRLQYLVDGQRNVENPVGMRAEKLATDTTCLTLSGTTHANLSQAIGINHLETGSFHHAAAMAAEACLSDEDRDLGALVLDFGGGTTSAALYMDKKLIYVDSVKLGGIHITRDIARILNLSIHDAERLKALDGAVNPTFQPALQMEQTSFERPSDVPASGDNFVFNSAISGALSRGDTISLSNGEVIERQLLSDIIRPRLEEILEMLNKKLVQAGMQAAMGRRIILTGGGAQLTGLPDFVSRSFQRPAILTQPEGLTGTENINLNGSLAASIGFALYLARSPQEEDVYLGIPSTPSGPIGRLSYWLREHI